MICTSNPLARSCILKYIIINLYINIREGVRRGRERREKVVGRRERKRENRVFLEKDYELKGEG